MLSWNDVSIHSYQSASLLKLQEIQVLFFKHEFLMMFSAAMQMKNLYLKQDHFHHVNSHTNKKT